MKIETKEKIFDVALIVITLLVLSVITGMWKECSDAGGIFVRGLFWFECLPSR